MAAPVEKQYGLILPSAKKAANTSTVSGTRKLNPVFNSDDELENEEESSLNWVEASLKKAAGNAGQKSLQKRLLREALEEDSSVFQYDEVYDKIQETKNLEDQNKKKSLQKKPKYIENILKQAENRKLQTERRVERQVQKERQAEGTKFADKEAFVTSSYIKKMEELKKAELEEKRQLLIEEKTDVMKHKNFGVFYNLLLKQKLGNLDVKTEPQAEDDAPSMTIKKRDDRREKNYRTQRDLSDSPERVSNKRIKQEQKSSTDTSSDDDDDRIESYRDRRTKYQDKTNIGGHKREHKNVNNRDHSTKSNGNKNNSEKELYSTKVKKGIHSTNHKHRSKSRDRSRRSRSNERNYRSKSIDRNHRSKSRDRDRRSRSRDRKRKSRSRERSRRSHSFDRNQKSRSRDRKYSQRSRERNHRSKSKEKIKSSKPYSRDRSNKSRSKSVDRSLNSKIKNDHNKLSDQNSSSLLKDKNKSKSPELNDKSNEKLKSSDVGHVKATENKSASQIKSDENKNAETLPGELVNVKTENDLSTENSLLDISCDLSEICLPPKPNKEAELEEKVNKLEKIHKLFAKRTVGQEFEDALQRYYQRKAERESRGN